MGTCATETTNTAWSAFARLVAKSAFRKQERTAEESASESKHSARERGVSERVAHVGQAIADAVEAVVSPPRSRLGDFELSDKVLGEGGYACVKLGRNRKTGETVAVKLLSTTSTEGRAAVSEAAVVREVAALRRCGRHPNVCSLLGYFPMHEGGLPSRHALVLEACHGGELFALVERFGALPEGQVHALTLGIVAGLRHLHARGIAHRDLKLENVILGGEGGTVPKIADLGLAHVHSPTTDEGSWAPAALTQFCGSRSYCAPEVMARIAYDGYRADLWSLGVRIFGLASGFFPVDEASPRDWRFERLARLQMGHPTRSSTREIYGFYGRECPLAPALTALLDAILRVQPAKRLPLEQIAASPWLAGEPGMPTEATMSVDAPELSVEADGGVRAPVVLEVDATEPVYRACDLHAADAADSAPSEAAVPCGGVPPMISRQRAADVDVLMAGALNGR